jgi:hypothetical protein
MASEEDQAMNSWQWLNTNSGAVQSTAAILAAVLTVVTIGVLIVTWKAIKVQADAARALTQTAERQNRLLSDQIELSTAPLLVFEPDDREIPQGVKVVNRGQGVAFQVHFWQGGFENFHPRPGTGYAYKVLDPSTIAPGMFVYLYVDPLWREWTVKYRGIDDQARATRMNRDNMGGQHYIIRRGGKELTLDDVRRGNGEKAIGDWTE